MYFKMNDTPTILYIVHALPFVWAQHIKRLCIIQSLLWFMNHIVVHFHFESLHVEYPKG